MICIYIGNMLFCKHFPTLNLHFNKRQFPFVLVYSFLFLSNILNANLIDNHKVGKICKLPNMQYHVLSIYVFKFIVFIFNGKKDMSDPHELIYVHMRQEEYQVSKEIIVTFYSCFVLSLINLYLKEQNISKNHAR